MSDQEDTAAVDVVTEEPATDIHTWFGLSGANYFVAPRTLLQSMPAEWQHRAVALFRELHEAYAHVPQADGYRVEAAEWVEASELTEAQRTATSIRVQLPPAGEPDGETEYYDNRGVLLQCWELVPVPVEDPVPHYDRGRAYIAPGPPPAST